MLGCPYCPWTTPLMGDAAMEQWEEHCKRQHIERVEDPA